MKKILLSAAVCCASIFTQAQSVNDSVLLGAGYSNQSFYSLLNGEVENIDNTTWELAFDVSGFGSTIRINGGAGVETYMYPTADTSGWGSLDTAGMSSWLRLYNSDRTWYRGAFDQTGDGGFDLGWGTYNVTTHHITGDSLYVVKLLNGSYKKLWLEKLASGIFSFRYADLDGSNEMSETVTKSDYSTKRFAYYSLSSSTILDREPAKTDWDFVIGKYQAALAPNVYYGVTGVLSNYGVTVAEKYPTGDPFNDTDYSSTPFDSTMNVIGYDWKTFNFGAGGYDLADSTAYFIKDVPGNIWRVVFTKFVGSSTGEVGFNKELIEEAPDPSSINDKVENTFTVYPNPATSYIDVVYSTDENNAQISILDIMGREVKTVDTAGNGFNQYTVDLAEMKTGVYIVRLTTGETVHLQKIIKK